MNSFAIIYYFTIINLVDEPLQESDTISLIALEYSNNTLVN